MSTVSLKVIHDCVLELLKLSSNVNEVSPCRLIDVAREVRLRLRLRAASRICSMESRFTATDSIWTAAAAAAEPTSPFPSAPPRALPR